MRLILMISLFVRGTEGLFGRETLYRREAKNAYEDLFRHKNDEVTYLYSTFSLIKANIILHCGFIALKMTFYFRFMSDNRKIKFLTKSHFTLRVIHFSFQSLVY